MSSKNIKKHLSTEDSFMDETPSRLLEKERQLLRLQEENEEQDYQYNSNSLNIDLLNEYLMDDDLLEQIERQYLSKNTKKNRSPISLTKAKLAVPSQDFKIHSLLDRGREQNHSHEEQQTASELINDKFHNTKATMVIENIIKSLVTSTGSNCHKIITERYIKDVVRINKSNQMWITNISKTDMSSCTLELQSISNTIARKKIPPCEKVVRITVYSSINGKPKKCIISTSHHPTFGFKTICETWIFESSTDPLPDTIIIPEQNILRFLQFTFIGSHTFANTHRIKHISVTLEDAILSNKEYLERVKMEIHGIQSEEPIPVNISIPPTTTHQSYKQLPSSNSHMIQNFHYIEEEPEKNWVEDDKHDLDFSNPLLKILNSNPEVDHSGNREENDVDKDYDIVVEEELEKELMQIEMKLNEKKKILDTISSPIKTIHPSPSSKQSSSSPVRIVAKEEESKPSPVIYTSPVVSEKKDVIRPSVRFFEKVAKSPQKASPLKKETNNKQQTKTIQQNSKPIVIEFNPLFSGQPLKSINGSELNKKPNSSLVSFLNQLQKYTPKQVNQVRKESSIIQQSPPKINKTGLILEKLNMQKKLKEELDQLKHLGGTNPIRKHSPPHIYMSPTKNVPFLKSGSNTVENLNDSDTSSDITLTVEEDELSPFSTSPIATNDSAFVVDFSPPRNQLLIPLRSAPSPPFRVVNDFSPPKQESIFENYNLNNLGAAEDEVVSTDSKDNHEETLEIYEKERIVVEETEVDDHDLLTTLESEQELIEQFNRGSNNNSQNNSFNIEIPIEMEEELNDITTNNDIPDDEGFRQPNLEVSLVQTDEDSIIQSFLDTTLSSDNSYVFTPTKSPNTKISTPLSLSIPHNNMESPNVELLTPSKILLKGEPSRLLKIKKGINCLLHEYDSKKRKYKVYKRTLKLDRDSKLLTISKTGKSLFKKTTKIDLTKDIKWIVYGPYSSVFKKTNIIYRPFKCFSIVTNNKVYSFEVLSEGVRDVDDTILGLQYLIQNRIKSFNRPIYTKCTLIVKRYLLKKFITFTNFIVSIEDDMSSITSDSLASPRLIRSKSFKF